MVKARILVYAQEIGWTIVTRMVQRHLTHFFDLGLLQRIGSKPATEYQVIQS